MIIFIIILATFNAASVNSNNRKINTKECVFSCAAYTVIVHISISWTSDLLGGMLTFSSRWPKKTAWTDLVLCFWSTLMFLCDWADFNASVWNKICQPRRWSEPHTCRWLAFLDRLTGESGASYVQIPAGMHRMQDRCFQDTLHAVINVSQPVQSLRLWNIPFLVCKVYWIHFKVYSPTEGFYC